VRLSRDGSLASEMIEHMVRGTTFAELARFRANLRGVSRAAVSAVTERYLDPAALALVRAGDFAAHRANGDDTDEA
jgi:hypothetical protein